MPLITQAGRALDLVATYGSVRRAAERINVTPSALNRQLLNLEEELGTALFERLPRGMRLTETGTIVLARVRAWQAEYAELLEQMPGLKSRKGGHVRIGVMECLATDFMSRAFITLQDSYPDATMRLVVSGTMDVARQLSAGEIDLAVTFNLPRDSGLKNLREVKMDLGAVVGAGHPLANLSHVRIDELFSYPIILADNAVTLGPVVASLRERAGKPSLPVVVTNSIAALKDMVAQGVGISVMTPIDVYGEVRDGRMRFVPISGTRMFELLSITTRDLKTLSPAAAQMTQIIVDMLADPCSLGTAAGDR